MQEWWQETLNSHERDPWKLAHLVDCARVLHAIPTQILTLTDFRPKFK